VSVGGLLQSTKTQEGNFVALIREDGTTELCEVVAAPTPPTPATYAVPLQTFGASDGDLSGTFLKPAGFKAVANESQAQIVPPYAASLVFANARLSAANSTQVAIIPRKNGGNAGNSLIFIVGETHVLSVEGSVALLATDLLSFELSGNLDAGIFMFLTVSIQALQL
jgi:hypothetical protein